jgi:hypothetical protein
VFAEVFFDQGGEVEMQAHRVRLSLTQVASSLRTWP